MCGIAGVIQTSTYDQEALVKAVQTMTDRQAHRGPDGAGVELICNNEPCVAFGHRRLAIIDLTPSGQQPMVDADTGNWITFNGEIYNYLELKDMLLKQGQTFRTESDTEVILKAYAVWGLDFLVNLRGIFAFGLWDYHKRKLILARDHLGVKPLYYWRDQHKMLFASEVRPLLDTGFFTPHLDKAGLHSYLRYGSVQEPNTLVMGIHSLPPASFLTWQSGKVTARSYWQLPEVNGQIARTDDKSFHEIREYLETAVSLQLISDVPIGAFLSGGIDSTAIVALMKQNTEKVISTSLVFDETDYDERKFSQLAAREIGTQHIEMELTASLVQQDLPAALAAYDQPSVDGLNTYFVSKLTRESGLTVALSGVGGDELFGGYSGYRKALLLEKWSKRLQYMPTIFRGLGTHLGSRTASEPIRRISNLLVTDKHPYFLSRQLFSKEQIYKMLQPEMRKVSDMQSAWEARLAELEIQVQEYDIVNQISALELQTYMLSTLLRDTDQMSMAHALEVRVPLIDYKLVEYMFRYHGSVKVDTSYPKPLLTKPLTRLIPSSCIFRRKQGFVFPLAEWIDDTMRPIILASMQNRKENDMVPFQKSSLQTLWKQFEHKQISWSRVWGIFILNDWLCRHGIQY